MKTQPPKTISINDLQAELDELRQQLFEANEIIGAIRTGQIDALVLEGEKGNELYTLKTADQAYRVFIENMSEGAVTLNEEGLILYANTRFAEMVGKPLSAVIGGSFHRFVSDDFAGRCQTFFLRCGKEGGKEELTLRAGEGTVPVQLSVTALRLEVGVAMSIIVTDLSAQKKTQQQLEEKNRQLAETNHALELSNHDLQQFASVASHDLQEPLRKIQMFADLLSRNGTENAERHQRYLNKVIASAGRMRSLIVDILAYSRLSAGENHWTAVSLNAVVNDLRDDFEVLINEKGAVIEAGDLPSVEANAGQLRQVFQNLLSNSLKFSKPGTPPVIGITAKRIAARRFDANEDAAGDFYLIRIKDNGIGFKNEYAAKIFSLFERLNNKDYYEGTGIGLAIAKKIIEKHRGLITARSKEGEGAEFLIVLPARQQNAPDFIG